MVAIAAAVVESNGATMPSLLEPIDMHLELKKTCLLPQNMPPLTPYIPPSNATHSNHTFLSPFNINWYLYRTVPHEGAKSAPNEEAVAPEH